MTRELEILTKPIKRIDLHNDIWHVVKEVKQLNYFYKLYPYNARLKALFNLDITEEAEVSLRRRIETEDDNVKDMFILKPSVNGSNRLEVTINAKDLSEEVLLYLESLEFASKWRRSRTVRENDKYPYIEFYFNENSGYGTTIELEYVGKNVESSSTEDILKYLRQVAQELHLFELTKDMLDKMYKFYCANWSFYFNNNVEFSQADWEELNINV